MMFKEGDYLFNAASLRNEFQKHKIGNDLVLDWLKCAINGCNIQ